MSRSEVLGKPHGYAVCPDVPIWKRVPLGLQVAGPSIGELLPAIASALPDADPHGLGRADVERVEQALDGLSRSLRRCGPFRVEDASVHKGLCEVGGQQTISAGVIEGLAHDAKN